MEMTKRVKCESCGGKGMIIPKKHGGMVVPRKCEHCNGTGTTEAPITNADRILAMSDEELSDLFHEIYDAGVDDAVAYECGQRKNSFEWTIEWLKQPAE